MCGEWGASRCSAEKWFEFMGDAQGNPFVPFQITYITTPVDGLKQLDPPIVPCNKAINVISDRLVFFKQTSLLKLLLTTLFGAFHSI